jgi:DNA processing protein
MVPTPLTESQLPPCIKELACPPRILHLCGLIPTRPMVAIVGTRRPTLEAVLFAEKLAQDLVAHGFAVASGGAAGVDSAAHRGALRANGQTLVVAPSGWYSPYPAINQQLFEQIVASDGGYLSLVDPYCKPMASHFFARNALMVALSRATVLIQAPLRSGARNAAHVARKLGRQLYVVPSTPWVEQGLGCILELKLGARPLGSIRDLLAGLIEIGVHGGTNPLQLQLPLESRCGSVSTRPRQKVRGAGHERSTARLASADPNLQPVLSALGGGCDTVDSVCAFTGWQPPKVQGALLRLTLDGHIRVTSAGQIEIVID